MAKKYYFVFCKEDLLLEKKAVSGSTEVSYTIPLQEEAPTEVKPWTNVLNITPLDGIEVKTYRIDAPVIDDERYEMCGLRKSYYRLERPLYLKAGKCQELLYWDQNTKYCGVCGAPMRMDTDISKKCTECGKEVWPQLATAVIVLIHRGDEVLLVTPIDSEAPEGRMILPQVQMIRDVLDNEAIAIVLKEDKVATYLQNHRAPKLVITDSQAFHKVEKEVPESIPLTGFSVVLAHHKGEFDAYLEGTPKLRDLRDGDRILMLENAVYSVISPEGCAGILWRDGAKAPEAAEALKITAPDLKRLGVIDEIVPERNLMANLRKAIVSALKELASVPVDELLERRYAKFTEMGRFI